MQSLQTVDKALLAILMLGALFDDERKICINKLTYSMLMKRRQSNIICFSIVNEDYKYQI